MSIPLNKLVDLTDGRYKIAKAAMNKIADLTSMNINIREETGEKLAVYILRRMLEGNYTFEQIDNNNSNKQQEE